MRKSVRHGRTHLLEAGGEDLDGECEDGLENEDNEYGCGAILGSGDQPEDLGAHDEYSLQGYVLP